MTTPAVGARMTRAQRRAANRWLARVAWTQRRALSRSVAGALLRQSGFLAMPLLLQFAVDDSIVTGDVPAGLRWAGLLIAAAAVQFLGMCWWQQYANLADARAGALLRGRLLERLWRPADPGQATDSPTGAGDLVLRAGRDVDLVRTWVHGLPSWAVIGVTVAVLVPGILGLDPMLLLVAAGTVPALLLVNLRYPRRFERAATAAATAHGRRADVVEHLLRSAVTTRGIGAETVLRDRHHERSAELTAAAVHTGSVGARWSALGEGVPMVATAVGVLAAVVAIGDNRLTVGGLVAFSGWMGTIGIAVTVGLTRMTQAVDARVAARRLLPVLDLGAGADPDSADPESAGADSADQGSGYGDGTGAPLQSRPRPGRLRATDLPTLDGRSVDLDLRVGGILAVTGPIGSGKSWLLRVLAGHETVPDGASVTLDDVPMAELDGPTRHRDVVLVPQRPLVMTGTVADNLCLGETVDAGRMRWALTATGLDADFADHGLDTVISDGASALSGGQVQRLALARALLTPARVLLLDDITSAVDPATEHLVIGALRAAARERVVVVATHRPAVLAAASTTVTLTGGRADLIGAGSGGDRSDPLDARPESVDSTAGAP